MGDKIGASSSTSEEGSFVVGTDSGAETDGGSPDFERSSEASGIGSCGDFEAKASRAAFLVAKFSFSSGSETARLFPIDESAFSLLLLVSSGILFPRKAKFLFDDVFEASRGINSEEGLAHIIFCPSELYFGAFDVMPRPPPLLLLLLIG